MSVRKQTQENLSQEGEPPGNLAGGFGGRQFGAA